MYVNYTDDQMRALGRDQVLLAWQEASTEANAAVQRERQLRQLAFQLSVPNPKEGVNNLDLGNGWLLKANHNLNYTVQSGALLTATLEALPKELAERLVKFQPKLSISTFKSLADDQARLFAPLVTIKPGLPSLQIIKPGDEGNKR